MTLRQRNILIISLGLLAVGLMIFLILRPKGPREAEVNIGTKLPEAIVPSSPRAPAAANVAPEEKQQMTEEQNRELEARRLANIFIERYGSFSNQGNYENVTDLYPLMTAPMRREADAYVRELKEARSDTSVYYGITTKSLSSSVILSGANRAAVAVTTQRQESAGAGGETRIIYQDATLNLIKIGPDWKVDNVKWGQVSGG